jgi:hypothetical protein
LIKTYVVLNDIFKKRKYLQYILLVQAASAKQSTSVSSQQQSTHAAKPNESTEVQPCKQEDSVRKGDKMEAGTSSRIVEKQSESVRKGNKIPLPPGSSSRLLTGGVYQMRAQNVGEMMPVADAALDLEEC